MTIESIHTQILARIRRSGTSEGLNLVAYSGGVDSTLTAHLVYTIFPENTLAMIGISASMPELQLSRARHLAEHIGLPLRELKTAEGRLTGYVENTGSSCYHCKMTLYETMQNFSKALVDELRTRAGRVVLFNGTNADDLSDPTRVGLKAAREYEVSSPLSELTKQEVRALSHHVGLPNWNYAASPCLRSRLQYGVQATPENLARIEAAEEIVRAICGLDDQDNLRVRHLENRIACIEVDERLLTRVSAVFSDIRTRLIEKGYNDVLLRQFHSGSLSFLAPMPA